MTCTLDRLSSFNSVMFTPAGWSSYLFFNDFDFLWLSSDNTKRRDGNNARMNIFSILFLFFFIFFILTRLTISSHLFPLMDAILTVFSLLPLLCFSQWMASSWKQRMFNSTWFQFHISFFLSSLGMFFLFRNEEHACPDFEKISVESSTDQTSPLLNHLPQRAVPHWNSSSFMAESMSSCERGCGCKELLINYYGCLFSLSLSPSSARSTLYDIN